MPTVMTARTSRLTVDSGVGWPAVDAAVFFPAAFSADDDVARAYLLPAAILDANDPIAILIQCVKALMGSMPRCEARRVREPSSVERLF